MGGSGLRLLLDTSVLIDGSIPPGHEAAISAVSIAERGGKPRARTADLAIAATAIVHDATLVTGNVRDFSLIDDLVSIFRSE